MSSRTAAFATAVLLLTLLVTNVLGQRQSTYLTQSRPIIPKVHGLGPRVLRSLGGVLSLANELTSRTHGAISVRLEHESTGDYPGHIVVHRLDARSQSKYRIDYASLVPMALLVDSGATSLYTLFDTDPARSNFMTDAGMLPHPVAGYVALEFGATPYAAALHALDLCVECLGNPLVAPPRKLDVGDIPDVVDWINTDAGLFVPAPYVFTVRNGFAGVSGSLVRYVLRSSFGEVVVDNAVEILEDADAPSETHFLFETLTLLRAAKEDDHHAWDQFMSAISSDQMVQAHPEPWALYTRSFCSVYPNWTAVFDCAGW